MIKAKRTFRISLLIGLAICLGTASRLNADTGVCGGANISLPFTDVAGSAFFCEIAEAYFTGQTKGTTATTFTPSGPVLRDQMVAFLTRTLDFALSRGSRRTIAGKLYTPLSLSDGGVIPLGSAVAPTQIQCDGRDLWVANRGSGTVTRLRANDGAYLGSWTGLTSPEAVLLAKGKVWVTTLTGELFYIDPNLPGTATFQGQAYGPGPGGIAWDGHRIWTAFYGDASGGGVAIATTEYAGTPTWHRTGFNHPIGIIYDGANMWVTDQPPDNQGGVSTLKRLGSNGEILQSIPLSGNGAQRPIFDGTNIWVPIWQSNVVDVVRASTGEKVATLSGNGLSSPTTAAFDGERVLVTNYSAGGVSLWKATDMTPLGHATTGAAFSSAWGNVNGACSDGMSFFVTLQLDNKIIRL